MKWDFFYDEGEGKPYKSFDDWHQEIKHLIMPLIIMTILIVLVFVYGKFLVD